MALHSIARRWAGLDTEIRALDRDIKTILDTIAAPLLARHGVGYETAGSLLCAAGDNPDRLATEASFAALCGTSPVPVSSGRSNRHRLNRAGDRQANAALWRIVIVRLRSRHAPTMDYLERRVTAGNSKRDAIRCLIGRVSAGGPSRLVRRERRGTASMSCHWMACLSWSPSPLVGPRDRHERPAPQRAEQ
jgi:transposase